MQQILHMDSTQLKHMLHMLVNLNHFSKCQGKKKLKTSLFNHRGELYSYAMCVSRYFVEPKHLSKPSIEGLDLRPKTSATKVI